MQTLESLTFFSEGGREVQKFLENFRSLEVYK